jgi:hypothetical protein
MALPGAAPHASGCGGRRGEQAPQDRTGLLQRDQAALGSAQDDGTLEAGQHGGRQISAVS